MFLQRIHIQRFRGIHDLELSFHSEDNIRKQTIILGENGAGKSNLLRAIALITAGSNAIGEFIDTPRDWISSGENQCRISATLLTDSGQQIDVALEIKSDDGITDIILNNHEQLREIDLAIAKNNQNYFVAGYGANRRLNKGNTFGRELNLVVKHPRANNVATLFNQEASLHPITAWAMEVDYITNGKGLDIIRESFNDFLPNVKFHSIDKEKGQLIFKQGSNLVPLHLLSNGYQNTITWLGDLYYRISNIIENDQLPFKIFGLLLIDEIDLHLHPKWQRHLLDFVKHKFPKIQLIATTHAPLIAQQVGEGELFVLKRNGTGTGKITIEAFKGAPNQLLIHQLLLSSAFELETDESLAVEQLKKKYLTLKKRKSTPLDQLNSIASKVNQLPQNFRSNMTYESEQLDLLRDIKAELKARKKE